MGRATCLSLINGSPVLPFLEDLVSSAIFHISLKNEDAMEVVSLLVITLVSCYVSELQKNLVLGRIFERAWAQASAESSLWFPSQT